MTTNRMVFSVDEMARELGISRPVAYELIKKDGFPAVRISDRRIVIPADKLRAWLNAQAER